MFDNLFGVKVYPFFISIIGALGGFLFGFDTAVISGAIGFLQQKFVLNSSMMGWTVSSAILGCIIGVGVAGLISDAIGRKKSLLITAFLFAISAIGCYISLTFNQLILSRIIGGVGVGAASILCPMYISEIAPAHNRGKFVSLYQLAIVLGINIAFLMNFLIVRSKSEFWNIEFGWRYMLGAEALPAIVFLVALFFIPESPRWLFIKGYKAESYDVLTKINTLEDSKLIYGKMSDVVNDKNNIFSDLLSTQFLKILLIGIFLAFFSQFTGINAIMYYAPEILKNAGFEINSAFMQTIIIGVVNTLFTFLAIRYIDKIGRKPLLLWGAIIMGICLFSVGLLFLFEITTGPWLLIFLLGFVACYASTLGPVFWVIVSEVFPLKFKNVGMSITIIALWINVFLISQFTPFLFENLGTGETFLLFMICSILLFIFSKLFVTETKGKLLEDIQFIRDDLEK